MYVEAAHLWSLIDLRIFRCPYHANDLREDATVPPDGSKEATNDHEHAAGADRKQRHP